MSVLLIVRHGQAHFGLRGYDRLSDQGRRQAVRLGQSLCDRRITVDRVVAGELHRQRQTAALVSEQLGSREVGIEQRWNEYDHLRLIAVRHPRLTTHRRLVARLALARGDRRRRLQALLDEALAGWVAAGQAPAPAAATARRRNGGSSGTAADGMPTFVAYRDAAHAALCDALDRPGTTLAVSSAGTIAAAIAPLLQLPAAAWPRLQRVVVNTSVTKVVRGPRGLSLVSFNEHAHLEGAPDVSTTYR